MTTKIDEIARAICEKRCEGKYRNLDKVSGECICGFDTTCHALASVALDAMAEPTQAMLCDGTEADDKYYFEDDAEKRVTGIFAAMIESAKGKT